MEESEKSEIEELHAVVAAAINEKVGDGHSFFRKQLESFIVEYMDKSQKYYKLPTHCAKHDRNR